MPGTLRFRAGRLTLPVWSSRRLTQRTPEFDAEQSAHRRTLVFAGIISYRQWTMQDLLNDIGRRFPLLESLKLSSGEGLIEKLPSFMGLLLAAFCFVFPRKDKIASLAAVLYSLGRFAVEFPTLAEEYARRVFTKGQRVK